MAEPNQSFTDFKNKKLEAEEQIKNILNDLIEEFDISVLDIDHENSLILGHGRKVILINLKVSF